MQLMPKNTNCNGCNLPIKIEELFVGCRFDGAVHFWHNRTRVSDDCWGKFLLEHVLRNHPGQAKNAFQKPALGPPPTH
jgi:hypothetical protein